MRLLQVGEARDVVATAGRGRGTAGVDPWDSGKAQKALRQLAGASGTARTAREARQPEEGGPSDA